MSDGLPTVTHDPESGFYRTEIDPSETRPFIALGTLLETIEESEPITTPKLYDLIDCEALDDIVLWAGTAPEAELDLEYTTRRLELVVRCSDGLTVMGIRPADKDS